MSPFATCPKPTILWRVGRYISGVVKLLCKVQYFTLVITALCLQVCIAVNPDEEAAVNYINSLRLDGIISDDENQYAIIILKRPTATEIPQITDSILMRPIEISDAFLDHFYSGSDNSVTDELRGTKNEYMKAWKANIDGDDVIVGWAKPQTISREDKNGKLKRVVAIHSEMRLIELLQSEPKIGKKVHMWTKNSPCENCADGSKARSIVNFKKNNVGMQLHLHHENIYVPRGLQRDVGVDEFMNSKQHLSGLDDDFTWTVSPDYQAENQKMNEVKNLDADCKLTSPSV